MKWLREWWWARQRATDLALLWPACVAQAPDLEAARRAFLLHAINDPAWVRYYGTGLWAQICVQCNK